MIGMLPRKVYSLVQKGLELRRFQDSVSQVLMFHHVVGAGETPLEPFLSVSAARFARFAASLSPDTVRPMADLTRHGSMILSFDDIFVSAFDHAFPVLREHGLPYTIFIAPGLLDQPGYISREQLRELTADPLCSIGAHSMTHCAMRPLSAEQVRGELGGSKRWLENFCGRDVPYFAFPYGSVYACSHANAQIVRECGFKYGFSTIRSDVRKRDLAEPWLLPRINTNNFDLQRKGF